MKGEQIICVRSICKNYNLNVEYCNIGYEFVQNFCTCMMAHSNDLFDLFFLEFLKKKLCKVLLVE
jgi:hypothetical protein